MGGVLSGVTPNNIKNRHFVFAHLGPPRPPPMSIFHFRSPKDRNGTPFSGRYQERTPARVARAGYSSHKVLSFVETSKFRSQSPTSNSFFTSVGQWPTPRRATPVGVTHVQAQTFPFRFKFWLLKRYISTSNQAGDLLYGSQDCRSKLGF